MSLNSKLDLRLEAARLVVQLPETTIDNFHERAYRVELYLTGDAELPEQDTSFSELKGMIQEVKDLANENVMRSPFHPVTGMEETAMGIGPCLGIGDPKLLKEVTEYYRKHPYAMPRSEVGPSVFLQQDGEKVE